MRLKLYGEITADTLWDGNLLDIGDDFDAAVEWPWPMPPAVDSFIRFTQLEPKERRFVVGRVIYDMASKEITLFGRVI